MLTQPLSLAKWLIPVGAGALFLYWWSEAASASSLMIVYFGRPSEIAHYVREEWKLIAIESAWCFATAIASLFLAGMLAVTMLAVGMLSDKLLSKIERIAALFQTIPTLIVVVVFLLIERGVFTSFNITPPIDGFCLIPVACSLVFAPLANGISAAKHAPISMKALLRMWHAKRFWRVFRIYLPYITTDILTGLRTSATWAVSAVLVAEGMINGAVGDSDTLGHALIQPSSNQPGETTTVIVISSILGFSVYYLALITQAILEKALYGKTAALQHAYPLQPSRRLSLYRRRAT